MLKIGTSSVNKIFIGSDEVNKAYLGNTLVYSSGPQPTPYKDMYLTFKIISGGTISWKATRGDNTKEIFYQINDGEWTSIVSTTAGAPINLSTGDVVKFKGDGAISTASNNSNRFSDSTIVFEVYGNIMSLIDSTGYTTATTAADHSFRQLFYSQTGLISAENLVLPATTIGTNVYKEMFRGCTRLTKAPSILPAATLAQSCYNGMFYGCSSLTTAPELPASTLAQECCKQMFRGCSSLTTAPSSIGTSASTVGVSGCTDMFRGCTSLTTAPVLPATALEQRCYQNMFYDCSSLNCIKCLATDISATNCTYNWVFKVSATGTFVKNPNMTSWTTGYNGIPNGWTVQDAT